ncbi:MAG: methylmalonyl Co-A mutase-associated GTPase MeaB [Anaerolineales bacterium]|nr:methylmalonyl Co-A mutase-associated GTPase MeaB [Anaerolineales bacterium]
MELVKSVLAGSRLALARALTQIENGTAEGRAALTSLFPHTGAAHLIGVTGAPGTGKSSLVNQLARYFRSPTAGEPRRVGIVAVDPSSPFTGGAILGDRVRMRDLAGDPGVFIRSMASRGSLGGLAAATSGVVQALDAAGFQVILIETVGAGQAEVDIARLAHTTLVIEAPGLGDDIQAIKAGILEIADILVVNKADRPGVETTERALRGMLQLAHPVPHIFQNHTGHKTSDPPAPQQADILWLPPIQRTVATEGSGVPELAAEISRHHQFLTETGELLCRERARLQSELDLLLRETLVARWRENVSDDRYNQALDQILQRQLSPWQAVEELLHA